MTKKNILTLLLDSVFVIAFNVVFFLNAETLHTASGWVCYAFLHFAYLMVLVTPLIEVRGTTAYLSKFSTYLVSLLYFLLELIFTIVIFYSKIDKTKLVIIIQTIFTAFYFIILISNLLANNNIARKQSSRDIQIDFIKTISTKAKFIASITSDTALKSKIDNLYYLLHSSPIKTCSEVAVYEMKIQEQLGELESLVTNEKVAASDKITEIEQTLNNRNLMLKMKS